MHHLRTILLWSSYHYPDFQMSKLKLMDTKEGAQVHIANKVFCVYESGAHINNSNVLFSVVLIHLVILKL